MTFGGDFDMPGYTTLLKSLRMLSSQILKSSLGTLSVFGLERERAQRIEVVQIKSVYIAVLFPQGRAWTNTASYH